MKDFYLHAFLMVRSNNGKWKVRVFQDIKDIVKEWTSRENPEKDVGVLHIGFNRPSYQIFSDIATSYLGRVLITAVAKHILPTTFVTSDEPVTIVKGIEVYLGLQGWEYYLEDMTTETEEYKTININNVAQKSQDWGASYLYLKEVIRQLIIVPQEPKHWIASYVEESPLDTDILKKHKIYNDDLYFGAEWNLDNVIRKRMGEFRVHYLVGGNCDDPCRFARAAPPWLAKQKWSNLSTSARVNNVFERNNIEIVADLAQWSVGKLLLEVNFGCKSLSDVLEVLNTALTDDSTLEIDPILNTKTSGASALTEEATQYSSLSSAIEQFLLSLDSRDRDIIQKRAGLEIEQHTLQKIADSHGITRERVRQIESKLKRRLRKSQWFRIFKERLIKLLNETNFPLLLVGIEAIDPWFKGIKKYWEPLKRLDIIGKNGIHVLEIDGTPHFSRIEQSIWNEAVENAEKFLSNINKEWTETEVCILVQAFLPKTAQEFRSLLWKKISQECYFNKNGCGINVLTSYGQGAEEIIEAILSESDVPLHRDEIVKRFNHKSRKNRNKSTIYNAIANVGFLFARGTYGLSQHLPLSDEQMSYICSKAEDIVCSETTDKQWHTNEILSKLLEKIDGNYRGLDKYILDIALARSKLLTHLKKMMWVKAGQDSNRINIHQAIVAIIRKAGQPLKANKIREQLEKIRGVNETFCIQPIDPLIRINPGTWGINDRDVPISREQQQILIGELVNKLKEKQSGIHLDELSSILSLQNCPPYAFLSIASQDERLKSTKGKYIYLAEWGSPRL